MAIGSFTGGAIQKFISLMSKQNGFARAAKYEIVLHPPKIMKDKINNGEWAQIDPDFVDLSNFAEDVSIMCDTVAMPGRDLQTHSAKYGTGLPTLMVNGHGFEGTIATTFYMDANLETKSFFEMWQHMAVDKVTNKVSYYYQNHLPTYAGTMEIYQLGSMGHTETTLHIPQSEKQGSKYKDAPVDRWGHELPIERTSVSTHKPVRKYGMKVHEVYPETIGQIEYAYATADTLALLPVQFQYKKWTTISPMKLNDGYSFSDG